MTEDDGFTRLQAQADRLHEDAARARYAPRSAGSTTRRLRVDGQWNEALTTLIEEGVGQPDGEGRRRGDRLVGMVADPVLAARICAAVNGPDELRDGGPPATLFTDPDTGLTVTLHPGPPADTVPSGAIGDRYEIRAVNPVRSPAALVLTAAEFAGLTRWCGR